MRQLRSMVRRGPRLLALGAIATASASAVFLWRAAVLDSGVFASNQIQGSDVGLGVRGPESGEMVRPEGGREQKSLGQDLLRTVDRAASASGVRVAAVKVQSTQDRPPAGWPMRMEVQVSGAGPYGSTKDLIERLLQSEPSLALDRVSLTRATSASGELDVQLSLHTAALEGQ
jgi:hypothetical protein